jgi:undecaprenyl diphosphate synthase
VEFLDLTFASRGCCKVVANVKSTPLDHGPFIRAQAGIQESHGRFAIALPTTGPRFRGDECNFGIPFRKAGRKLATLMSQTPLPSILPAASEAPRHVAIIMDGNGRWAEARGLPRGEGHRRGVEALRRTVRAAGDLGIGTLTIFSFSAENWSRPKSEIRDLMGLLRLFVRNDLADLNRNNVRVKVIGERDDLAPDIRGLVEEAETLTRANTGLTVVVAFNYGSRQEIARSARALAREVQAGRLDPEQVTAERLATGLYTAAMPDPDLIIRTSGEQRLSNFLLWQGAYSELVFLPIYWPDFDRAALEAAIDEYRRRERRFGGLVARAGS